MLKMVCAESIEVLQEKQEWKDFEAHTKQYVEQVHALAKENLDSEELEWVNRWIEGEVLDWKNTPKRSADAILYIVGQGLG